MTVAEYAGMIGKPVRVNLGGLMIAVIVKDIKQSYGKARFLVVPPAPGSGEIWVETVHELPQSIVDGLNEAGKFYLKLTEK